MDQKKLFEQHVQERIKKNSENKDLKNTAKEFLETSMFAKYSYNFSWLGRPIIQYPQDLIAMQEIIWNIKPDLIIEAGIALGGSLIFYASLLKLIGDGEVIGIDTDIRAHNKQAMLEHPLIDRITMLEGSSIDQKTFEKVKEKTKNKKNILVCLDSNHEYSHVLQELNLYAPLVTLNSYIVVFDTLIEDMPEGLFTRRNWGNKNNPKMAVREFLKTHDDFEIDQTIENKLLITACPSGYLKRKKQTARHPAA